MTASTASARGKANRRRGHEAERALARWLRGNGWPHAERAVRTGFRAADRTCSDPGDITGMPGVVVSVKDCAVEQIAKWMVELDAMAEPGGVRLLVHKRRGHADPGRWWCWLRVHHLLELADDAETSFVFPVRLEVGDVVLLLRAAGYGNAADAA